MSSHMTPGRRFPQAYRVPNRVPCHAPVGGPHEYLMPSHAGRKNVSVGGHGSCPRIEWTLTETGNQYGGVAHRVSVHSERNGSGGSGVAWWPIPTLQNHCDGCNAKISICCWTVKMSVSSQLVTTRSVMGFLTSQVKTSPPRTCVMPSSSIQVIMCRR